MFVRLTYFSIAPEKAGEIKEVYNNEVAPVIYQQPGIKDVMLLEPLSDGDEFISCTIWDDEAAIKAFESAASYPGVFAKIKAAALRPPHQKYFNAIKHQASF